MGRISTAFANVAAIGCLASGAFAAPAEVERIHGVVEQRASNAVEWQQVVSGQRLPEGTTIRTVGNSEVDLVLARGHRFHLRSDTTLELTTLKDDVTQTRLDQGRVLSQVKHLKSGEQFSLQTPTAVCAVRGTEFDTSASDRGTMVAVFKGIVGVTAGNIAQEVSVRAGQMTSVHDGIIEPPRGIPRESRSITESRLSRTARHEVALDMSRNQVIAAAAEERRLADYEEGKTLIDSSGKRVRLEEYIVRPEPDQFKFVALDERGTSQLDYFYYLGTFNKNLPTDLSAALKDLSGTIGSTAPDYFLTAYDTGQSNTQDTVHDTSTGGHLVSVTLDSQGNYTLTDPTNPSNTKTIVGAQLQSDGTYKVYNPLADSFSVVSAGQLSAATQFGVYIPENDTFRNLAPGDTVWKTRFNTYEHDLDNVMKISYGKSATVSNILTTTTDANYTYAGGFVTPVVQTDPNNVDATITNYYGDGTFESYHTTLIDDQGNVAPQSDFAGISTGAAYKNELLNWNYEQQVSATEFQGRTIDLVVEPRIFINSGLIQ